MAEPTRYGDFYAGNALNSLSQPCADGDDIYSITNAGNPGIETVTLTTAPGSRPIYKLIGGRPYIYYPVGVDTYFTCTTSVPKAGDLLSFAFVFDQRSLLRGSANNVFCSIWSTNSVAAGTVCRISAYAGGSTGGSFANGGYPAINDGTLRQFIKSLGTSILSSNGSAYFKLSNIMVLRPITAIQWGMYMNGTDIEMTSTKTALAGTESTFYVGRHSTLGSGNFQGGYMERIVIYNSAISGAEAIDSYNAMRTLHPFLGGTFDPTRKTVFAFGDSFTFSYGTNNNSNWYDYLFTGANGIANFGAEPQWLCLGYPGQGNTQVNAMITAIGLSMFAQFTQPVFLLRGFNNAIRSYTLTPAQAYAAGLTWANALKAQCPNAAVVIHSTDPRTSANANLESLDTTLLTKFTQDSNYSSGLIYKGIGGDYAATDFLVYTRGDSRLGGPGSDTTAAGTWTNTDTNTFQNLSGWFFSDKNHPSGTDQNFPGYARYSGIILPLFQTFLNPVAGNTTATGQQNFPFGFKSLHF